MDSLAPDIAATPRKSLQTWLDPLVTECACGWHGPKLRLIPVQDSQRRLCPECLMDVAPR